jgi:hypothetical protein
MEMHVASGSAISRPDERLLKRAQRLAAAAQAVEALDLKAIAESYQREAGSSGLEAATVATTALNAALKASLGGAGGAGEAAEREVKAAAKRKAREARCGEWLKARADEEGVLGDKARAEAHAAFEARVDKATSSRDERLEEDAATKRAMREERASMAASRRALSEARARFGVNRSRKLPEVNDSYTSLGPQHEIDDPVLRRAKNLCSGASRIVAQLEEQNRSLLQRTQAPVVRPPVPVKPPISPSTPKTGKALSNAEEDALVARARELLVDYKPEQGRGQRARTPLGQRSKTPLRSEPRRPIAVAVEMSQRSEKLRF